MSRSGAIVVFLGPTLPLHEARQLLDAEYLPPVSQGDLLAVAHRRPQAIGIVDGYFEHVPAVWHKEILWALSQGIHVFGASSMGALRAVELETYGMVGVGRVFEDFRSGRLQDDDEVALIHGPAESGYLPLSEAMVDIRATLAAARAAGFLTELEHDRLVALGKSLFYPQRTYFEILALAARHPELEGACARLAAWLPQKRVSQKREDAALLLRLLAERRGDWEQPKQVRFFFHHTALWEALRRQGARQPAQGGLQPATHLPDAVIEELQLEGKSCLLDLERARCRALALALAERDQLRPLPAARIEAEAELRRRFGLAGEDRLEAWLAEQKIEALGPLLDAEALAQKIGRLFASLTGEALRDQLRLAGRYGALEQRALAKHRELGNRGLAIPCLADAGLTEEQLWSWYFAERLAEEVPADLAAYAADRLFGSVDALRQAALREYLFVRIERSGAEATSDPRGIFET